MIGSGGIVQIRKTKKMYNLREKTTIITFSSKKKCPELHTHVQGKTKDFSCNNIRYKIKRFVKVTKTTTTLV